MPHFVKVLGTANIQLPDGLPHKSGDIVSLTDDQFSKLSATAFSGGSLADLGEDQAGVTMLELPVDLASVPAGAGQAVINLPLEGHGTITKVAFVVSVPGAGAGATRALSLQIGATPVTGGVVTVTLANSTEGAVINGTPVTAANVFNDNDNLSVNVAAGTVFTAGRGSIVVTIQA